VPDHLVGINNDASEAGRFRIWVTNLATGATEEQDGPPYGFPIEFSHPDEREPGAGDAGNPGMVFTFLPGTRPAGVTVSTRFYAWASVEEAGTVVAWDYAPDIGWVGKPQADGEAGAEVAQPPVAEPETPVPVGNPVAPAAMPECDANAYDFIGNGTLRGLGLHTATPVMPDGIDQPARIWVTRDLMPYDAGPPGGPVEMTRMLCFEFADGSGGSGWPVDSTWQPPADGAIATDGATGDNSWTAVLPAALLVLLALGISALAFRSRR
jgi:hypothetical protein